MIQQLKQFDLQHYARWPIAVKLLCWILLFIVVLSFGYVVLIDPKVTAYQQAKLQQLKLLKDFRTQHEKLTQLKYQQQHTQQLNAYFRQQLQQLPQQQQIPSLLTALHQIGQKLGLNMINIHLEPTTQYNFLLEQPIEIEVQGDYHALGHFVSEIAELSYLVTLHDFNFEVDTAQRSTTQTPLLHYQLHAKTYLSTAQKSQ